MSKRTIRVTQYDIDHGQRSESDGCPVALALSRELGRRVNVGETIWRLGPGQEYTFTPASVEAFVQCFDRARPVRPFEFEIEEPDPVPVKVAEPTPDPEPEPEPEPEEEEVQTLVAA